MVFSCFAYPSWLSFMVQQADVPDLRNPCLYHILDINSRGYL